jgi:hypothetical protein
MLMRHYLYLCMLMSLCCYLYFNVESSAVLASAGTPKAVNATTGSKVHYDLRRVSGTLTSCYRAIHTQIELVNRSLGGVAVLSNIRDEDLAGNQALPYSAIIFVFAGCRAPKEFIIQGVPERQLVQQLMLRGGLVLAITAKGRCWDSKPSRSNVDIRQAVQILRYLIRANDAFGYVPLAAAGTSAGAMIASQLATVVSLHALVAYVSPLHAHFVDNATHREFHPFTQLLLRLAPLWLAPSSPALASIVMLDDHDRYRRITAQFPLLKKARVQYAVFSARPWNFTRDTFHMLLPGRLSASEGRALFNDIMMLVNKPCLLSGTASCEVAEDPRYMMSNISAALRRVLVQRKPFGMYTIPSTCCSGVDAGSISNGRCLRTDFEGARKLLLLLPLAVSESQLRNSSASDVWKLMAAEMELHDTANAIRMLLKTAYGFHGMATEFMEEVVDLLLQGSISLNQ